MRKFVSAAVGALALALSGAIAVNADEDTTIYAESAWLALDTGPGPWSPLVPQTPSVTSAIVDASTADATWAAGNLASEIGTSIETGNLGHDVEAGTEITVTYELRDGASAASGSVRLFAYLTDGGTPGNRPATAPDAVAVAPADATSGTLTATIGAGTVGYIGLTYDTSNGGVPGTVRFSNLTVGGDAVSFTAKPLPDPEAPTVKHPECDCLTGTLTIPASEIYTYRLEGQPIAAGDHEVTPGEYVVTAHTLASGDEPVASWTLTVNEPPSAEECNPGTDDGNGEDGSEDGTDDGTEDGSENGTDDGTEEGSEDGDDTGDDAGTEDGSETGSDDGTEDGTQPTDDPTPTPTPTDDGGDDTGTGNDAGDDGTDNLPDTGGTASPWLFLVGGSAMLVGAVVLVFLRRRALG